MSYQGMRWYKCDFQMQTPGDHYNWCPDDPAYISGNASPEEIARSAEMYLTRCHEVGLEVICVTDHNFIGRVYLEMLQQKNEGVADRLNKNPLTIFPGFEIEISQGLGVHLLCIFNHDKSLQDIDDIVTRIGLPQSARVRNGNIVPLHTIFDELSRVIQDEHHGIIVAAHPTSESGFLNDRFITDNFQRDMFINPKLLAMEIPKPLDTLSTNWRKLITAAPECNPEWRRDRRIAAVMSSDAYRLTEGDKGYIGKRATWIKMSNPCIESVIQAFLDCDRIKLQDISPDEEISHDRIVSLSINNCAFLDDQTIHFSPNLNCIIGGRGSGKSSILEYIRLSSTDIADIKPSEQLSRIKNTLSSDSKINMVWQDKNGLVDTFEYVNETPSLTSRDVAEPLAIFRNLNILVISQREISNIAQEQSYLADLVESLTGSQLKRKKEEELELISQIASGFQNEIRIERIKSERNILLQEKAELKRQWDAFEAVKLENEKKIKASQAARYISDVQEEVTKITEQLTEIINIFTTEHQELIKQDWTESTYFDQLNANVSLAKAELKKQIDQALQNYGSTIIHCTVNHDEWNEITNAITKTESDFLDACREQGLQPEAMDRLFEIEKQIQEKDKLLDEKEEWLKNSSQQIEALYKNIECLRNNWREQTELKKSKINELLYSGEIPLIESGHPFIKVEISYMKDKEHFLRIWDESPVRRNTKLGRSWEMIGEHLFNQFIQQQETDPWVILNKWIIEQELIPEEIMQFHADLTRYLKEEHKGFWQKLQTTRINDLIDITLFRSDGSRAGSLTDNGLSDGQKNTAVLALLFSDGTKPIVIDQPEDELDSDFIYNELVPLLRKVKHKRQIILTTHNANIPVNGDSELVYALSTNMGRGKVRAEGGLEKPNVRNTVLQIMEGSEEAFHRRREKYSF
ncbi:AAA family ATPase [Paenibacillus illinoisensis]|uniref:TrlF family AAA-like ATPase n=1 Tax=Paenibacillus illinoisensis TaxID=59845 RepID=UPI0034B4929D